VKSPMVLSLIAVCLTFMAGCAPAMTTRSDEPAPVAARQARTLVLVSGAELPSYAAKKLLVSASTSRAGIADSLMNANLVFLDERGLPRPYLTEALPELNTSTWQLWPDGTMETTYLLRPNLTWHDGQPLTAEDFVFAQRVYATPEYGVAESVDFRLIQGVSAPDPRSVVIRWKALNPNAGAVSLALPPLPRHILARAYQEDPGTFIGLQYWTSEYVGLGPWKLERREPGSSFEAGAFDGFVFGRPKIDRVRVLYQPDMNTVVATILAGEAHLTDQALLHGYDGITLEQAWASNQKGVVLWASDIGKGWEIQMRPESAVPTQLASDRRVRQALAFAVDKSGLHEVVTAGRGVLREVWSHPNSDYYDTVARAVPDRYAYDPRRAEQLLQEAGFTRGGDGGWLTPSGGRFALHHTYLTGTHNERDATIGMDSLRRFGIETSTEVFGTQRTSREERAKMPATFNGSITLPDKYHTREAAGTENRWVGGNRYGFSHPEMDRLTDAYETTMGRSDRIQLLAQLERVAMEQMPAIITYYNSVVVAHSAALKGVVNNLVPEAGDERLMWTWEWVS